MKNYYLPVCLFLFFIFFSLPIYSQKSEIQNIKFEKWCGFERESFLFNQHEARIVKPAVSLEGAPWLWRAYFPDWHTEIDSILLARGFHIAYINVSDYFGAPFAMGVWNDFYEWLVSERGFAEKVALEGVSRGGLYIYGWAKRNPSKVNCIYAEAPVCDFKSWPGAIGKSPGSVIEWNKVLKAYKFTHQEALDFKDNPIDNLSPLASFKVPVLHSIGLNDSVVPNDENTYILINRYIQAGGIASVIPMTRGEQKNKGHHFTIENPHKIADYIYSCSYPVKKMIPASEYHEIRGGLTNSLLKFTREKKGRVAFMGGSITEMNGWRNKVCQYLMERFPDTEFEFINAGISSTGSTPGAFRFSRDVLAKGEIDLLFEEASVNDRTNGFDYNSCIRGMEGIVNHALRSNPYMDIVLMYFIDPQKMQEYNNGTEPYEISAHNKVAEHYNIPSINLAKEVTERINADEFTWEYDFKNLHPSPYGCEIYFQSIRTLLNNCWNSQDTSLIRKKHNIPQLIDKFSYINGRYENIHNVKISSSGWTINENWTAGDNAGTRKNYVNVPVLLSETPGSEIVYKFRGKAVGICITSGPDAGMIEYSIDNKPFKQTDLYTQWSGKLHLPWYIMLDDELKSTTHTLRIRISGEKNNQSKGYACRILHFLVQ